MFKFSKNNNHKKGINFYKLLPICFVSFAIQMQSEKSFAIDFNSILNQILSERSCESILNSSNSPSLGSANQTDYTVNRIQDLGLTVVQSNYLLASILNNLKSETVTTLKIDTLREHLINYLMKLSKDEPDKYNLFSSKWNAIKSKPFFVNIFAGQGINIENTRDLASSLLDIHSILPQEIQSKIPSAAILALQTAQLFNPSMSSVLDTIAPMGASLLGSFLTKSVSQNETLSFLPTEFVTEKISRGTDYIATNGATITGSFASRLNSPETAEQLQKFIFELDVVFAYIQSNMNHESNPLVINLDEQSSSFSLSMESVKGKNKLHLPFKVMFEGAGVHLLIGNSSGRSALLNLIESKVLLSSLGFPELQLVGSTNKKLKVHISNDLSGLALKDWLNKVVAMIKSEPNVHHLILWDNNSLTANSINQIFSKLNSQITENGNKLNYSLIKTYSSKNELPDSELINKLSLLSKSYRLINSNGSITLVSFEDLRAAINYTSKDLSSDEIDWDSLLND